MIHISTLVGYLMANPVFIYIYIYIVEVLVVKAIRYSPLHQDSDEHPVGRQGDKP